jgi:ABC-type nickel/cobalt efflux system permease component RcnA
MKLDTTMQIVFGISAIIVAVLGIWFAWRSTRGM